MGILRKALSNGGGQSVGAAASDNIDREWAKGKTAKQVAEDTGQPLSKVRKHLRS